MPETQASESQNLVAAMAQRYNLSPDEFKRVIKATCGLQKATDEEFLAFLMIAHQYDLNPITREIYAFVKSSGGIQPIVGVDGWYKKMNEHPASNGIQFRDEVQGGQLVSVTATVYRKDRTHPIEATEYMKECRRDSDPWRKWPARMLRHKAAIQAIRMAYNLAGLMDPDEAERYMAMLTLQDSGSRETQSQTQTHDDLPLPTAGRSSPVTGAAVEVAVITSPAPVEGEKEQPANPPPPPISEAAPDEVISEEEWDRLVRLGDSAGLSASKLKHYVEENYSVADVSELRKSQATKLQTDLKKRATQKK